MNKQTEALKMAVEAMQSAYSSHGKILPSYPAQDAWMFHGCDEKLSKALQACKEALAQPAQEPFGYWVEYGEEKDFDMAFRYPDKDDYYPSDIKAVTKLYTHPAPAWQGLSDDDKKKLQKEHHLYIPTIEKIESMLKEKNHEQTN